MGNYAAAHKEGEDTVDTLKTMRTEHLERARAA